MPPLSKRIEEEGVLIEEFKLTEQGKFREEELVELFKQATYPPRNPDQNIADLKAQIAANQKGIEELRKLVEYLFPEKPLLHTCNTYRIMLKWQWKK